MCIGWEGELSLGDVRGQIEERWEIIALGEVQELNLPPSKGTIETSRKAYVFGFLKRRCNTREDRSWRGRLGLSLWRRLSGDISLNEPPAMPRDCSGINILSSFYHLTDHEHKHIVSIYFCFINSLIPDLELRLERQIGNQIRQQLNFQLRHEITLRGLQQLYSRCLISSDPWFVESLV